MLPLMSPQDVKRKLEAGEIRLVDIREPDEVESLRIEGAEIACAVLLDNVDATTAEADGLVLARGMSIVAENALTMDASVDTALERELKNQQLAAYGIVVRQG